MKPWTHPQELRGRIYFSVLIVIAIVSGIVIPLALLQDPTRDHIIISILAPIICILSVFFCIKAIKKLPEEYRTEPEPDATTGQDR